MEPVRPTEWWPDDPAALAEVQRRLGTAVPPPWTGTPDTFEAAACFVCFAKGRSGPGARGEKAWAVAVRTRRRTVVERAIAVGTAAGVYEPGLLAGREGRVLYRATRSLKGPIDVLLVNATGRDHPRRGGLALHLGAALGVPTIGVTDRPLIAEGPPPGAGRGATSPLQVDGERVAVWLRSRAGSRPIVVHPAWRTDIETAVEVALRSLRRARTPEPLRRARHAARLARAGILTADDG